MSTAAITLPVQRHRQPLLSALLIGTGLTLVTWGRALPSRRASSLCDRDAHSLARAREAAIVLRDTAPRYGFHS